MPVLHPQMPVLIFLLRCAYSGVPLSRSAAIHSQCLAGDKGSTFRNKESDRIGDILRQADPAQRCLGRHSRSITGLADRRFVGIWTPAIDVTRCNRIDTNAMWPQFIGHTLSQPDNARLADAIDGSLGHTRMP